MSRGVVHQIAKIRDRQRGRSAASPLFVLSIRVAQHTHQMLTRERELDFSFKTVYASRK